MNDLMEKDCDLDFMVEEEFSTKFYPKLSSSNIKLYVCDDNGKVDYSKRLYVSQKLAEKLIKLIEIEQNEEKL